MTYRPLAHPDRHRIALTAALTALVMWLALPAQAQSEAPRTITVTGEAETRVAPDMAMLRVEVLAENREASVARREADEITLKALSLIRFQGVADDDIDSTGLSISPQYRWLKDSRTQELTGYRVSRSIQIRLLDLEQLGELLEKLTDTGVNRVLPPELGLVDDEAIYRQTLSAAAENARQRAEVIATTLGEQLGAVQQANIYDTGPRPQMRFAERAMMAADAAAPEAGASYNSGHLTYRVSVNTSFLLD